MAVSYNKLLDILKANNITLAELARRSNFSLNISTRIKRNEYISLESIEKICKTLECSVDDIIEFRDDSAK